MPRAGKTPHDDLLVSTHTQLGLLCAANLAFRHIPFQFGGTAEPDLTWNLGAGAQGSLRSTAALLGLAGTLIVPSSSLVPICCGW